MKKVTSNSKLAVEADKSNNLLSAKVKELNENNINHKVEFNFLETKQSYKPESKRCSLCIAESYHISYSKLENMLNSKTEINGKCRHRSKYKIGVIR